MIQQTRLAGKWLATIQLAPFVAGLV